MGVRSSSFDNHWHYLRYHELMGRKSASFIWCIKACVNLNGLFKWTEKTLKRIKKKPKNTCRRAAFLEILQAGIIFQGFSCIRKLIFQGNFYKYIQNTKIQNINLKHTSFHISINSLRLYLSRKLDEFSLKPVYIHHDWEIFSNLWCLHSQKIH